MTDTMYLNRQQMTDSFYHITESSELNNVSLILVQISTMSYINALSILRVSVLFNLLPHMPILGSFNSAANKDMMSKILTNGDTVF